MGRQMKPRADFVCLSKKCEQEEGAVPFEASVDAKVCPECGSKRIKRLYNKVGVIGTRATSEGWDPKLTSNSHFVRSSAMLQDMYDQRSAQAPPGDMRSMNVADFAARSGGQAGVRVQGQYGKAAPMESSEISRVLKDDMKRYKMPTSPSSVMSLMSKRGIPTRPIRSKDDS